MSAADNSAEDSGFRKLDPVLVADCSVGTTVATRLVADNLADSAAADHNQLEAEIHQVVDILLVADRSC